MHRIAFDTHSRRLLTLLVAAVALICATVVVCAAPAQAEAKASVKQLSFQYKNGVKLATTTFKVDLNRKGGAEKLKVVPFYRNTRLGAKGLKFYVGSKKALTVTGKFSNSWFSLHYLRLSKKAEYLLVGSPTKSGAMTSALTAYEYKGGKFVEVVSLSQSWGKLGKPTEVTDVLDATANSVAVVYSFKKSPVGNHQFKLTYTIDPAAGTWELSSTSASVYYGPSSWKATVTKKIYSEAAPTKVKNADGTVTKNPVVATMKKGAKVKKVRVSKNGYVRVTLKNGKTGWFYWNTYKAGKPFKGVKSV